MKLIFSEIINNNWPYYITIALTYKNSFTSTTGLGYDATLILIKGQSISALV